MNSEDIKKVESLVHEFDLEDDFLFFIWGKKDECAATIHGENRALALSLEKFIRADESVKNIVLCSVAKYLIENKDELQFFLGAIQKQIGRMILEGDIKIGKESD